eukprot:g9781.t1
MTRHLFRAHPPSHRPFPLRVWANIFSTNSISAPWRLIRPLSGDGGAIRATLGLVGFLTAAAAVGLRHARLFIQSSQFGFNNFGGAETEQDWEPFSPRIGVDKVTVKPGPPSALLGIVTPDKGPTCLFTYGSLRDHDEGNLPFATGSKIRDGWLYGAALKRGKKMANPTGLAADILKGRLLCWQRLPFQDKLRAVDKERGYVPGVTKTSVKRGIVSVVLQDGQIENAYWFYEEEKKKMPVSILTLKRANSNVVTSLVSTRPPVNPLPTQTAAPAVHCVQDDIPNAAAVEVERLPIMDLEDALAEAAKENNKVRIVVEAPTGSGKSTQVPQMLLDHGCADWAHGKEQGEIVVLQPRRLAAKMLARRVADERGVELGQEVGYTYRFEDVSSPATRIRYVTEGTLLRRLLNDPSLSGVSAVVFDEFHERHFYGDVSLARCLEAQNTVRPDLRLVVMSATLQVEALNAYLGEDTKHLISEGRTYPVETLYAPSPDPNLPIWDHVTLALEDHFRVHEARGHTLVFLPGTLEIRRTLDALEAASWTDCFSLHALYGELSPRKVDLAVGPSANPKIICATNIAETSLTIDGVRLVVDSGLERRSDFDVRRSITMLTIEQISQASADQRCGRAGRTGPGICLRLWSEEEHAMRAVETPAEIHRMDLAEAVLLLKASGINNLQEFQWFEAPGQPSLDRANRWLKQLGAIDLDTDELTPLGWKLSRLPLAPRFARMLLEAAEQGVNPEFFAFAAAVSQARPLFQRQSKPGSLGLSDFMEREDTSDFQALFRAWLKARDTGFDGTHCSNLGINAGAARDIDKMMVQFMRLINAVIREDRDAEIPTGDRIGRILLTGFSDRLALRHSLRTTACAVVGGRRGELDRNSVVLKNKPPIETRLFVAGEMLEIEGQNDITVRLSLATFIQESWLRERYPRDFQYKVSAVWSPITQAVMSTRETCFRDLVLESSASEEPPPEEEATALLVREIMAGRLALRKWDQNTEQWIGRVNTVAYAFPEYQIPPIDEEGRRWLLTEICQGATRFKEIRDRPVNPILRSWLPAEFKPLIDMYAPERVELSNGRSTRVVYSSHPDEKPKISVLIQHLFGVKETPTIADGHIPLLVEILAPNSRPCQLTEDLAGFWKGSYAQVRAELRGRYPKHQWPEPEQADTAKPS